MLSSKVRKVILSLQGEEGGITTTYQNYLSIEEMGIYIGEKGI